MEDNGKLSAGEGVKKKKDFWGLAVCLGTIVTFVAGIGHVNSFGIIYKDLIRNADAASGSITTAHAVFAIMLSLGGILSNMVTSKVGTRKCGFIGSSFFILGSFLSVFLSSTSQLIVTFGILQGIGFGIMVPICYTTINDYFVERRTMIISLCKTAQGIFHIVYPLLCNKSMDYYGFRGTLLLLAGVALLTIPGMATMTPKRVKASSDKGKSNKLLQIEDNKDDDAGASTETWCNSKRAKLSKILSIELLKKGAFCSVCFCQGFVNFSDLTFFMFQPMLLDQYGFAVSEVASVVAAGAAADVAGRSLMVAVSAALPVHSRLLYYCAALASCLLRIVILQTRQFPSVVALTAVLGLLRAWLHIASPLVVADTVPRERFHAAYGLFMLVSGLLNLALGPATGFLSDNTKDLRWMFYILAACCLPCIVIWPAQEILVRKRRHLLALKVSINADELESSTRIGAF